MQSKVKKKNIFKRLYNQFEREEGNWKKKIN